MPEITEQDLARARELRAAGISWNTLGRQLGHYGDSLKRRLDPEYNERRNKAARETRRRAEKAKQR